MQMKSEILCFMRIYWCFDIKFYSLQLIPDIQNVQCLSISRACLMRSIMTYLIKIKIADWIGRQNNFPYRLLIRKYLYNVPIIHKYAKIST